MRDHIHVVDSAKGHVEGGGENDMGVMEGVSIYNLGTGCATACWTCCTLIRSVCKTLKYEVSTARRAISPICYAITQGEERAGLVAEKGTREMCATLEMAVHEPHGRREGPIVFRKI